MDKFENNNNINNEQSDKIKIKSIGFNLQLDLILSLTSEQYSKYNMDFYDIYNIDYLKDKINENLLQLITISSKDFLFNTILFINKSNKKKSNINYIIPFIPIISNEISFIQNIINNNLKNNNINIIPLNLMHKKAEIKFIFNLIKNNKIIETKKYYIENNWEYNAILSEEQINNKKNEINGINKKDYKKVKELIKSLNKCDFVLSSSNNINKIINIFEENKSFEKIIEYLELMKLCIIFDNPLNENFKKKIISITDIYFFEKSELKLFFNTKIQINKKEKDIYKQIKYFIEQIEQKEYKKIKIEIVIDKLNQINIIQHDSSTQLIIQKFEEPILLYKINPYINNGEEENLIKNNYQYLKSAYIGAFLSRFFYEKTFNTCFKASMICVNKVIKIIKNQQNNAKENINNSLYKTFIKNKLNHSKSIGNLNNSKLESQFILDGNNICEMNSKKEYNSIYDDNCISFFESIHNRNFLYKQGFINKKGRILIDPDRIRKSPDMNNKKTLNKYQKEMKNFYKIKMKNDISQKILEKLSIAKDSKVNKAYFNMMTFNKLNKQKIKKEYFLPSFNKEKSDLIFGNKLYNKVSKKIKNISNSNINKRYFKSLNFNKIYYKKTYFKSNSFNNNKARNIDYFKYKHRKYSLDG